jgi:hypothetical protein
MARLLLPLKLQGLRNDESCSGWSTERGLFPKSLFPLWLVLLLLVVLLLLLLLLLLGVGVVVVVVAGVVVVGVVVVVVAGVVGVVRCFQKMLLLLLVTGVRGILFRRTSIAVGVVGILVVLALMDGGMAGDVRVDGVRSARL